MPARCQTKPPPLYLTLDEAAELLRVSRNTVKRLIQAGTLPATYPSPRRTLISRHVLEDYLAGGGCRP
jgi:excisionase family DNA binding protein